MLEWSAAEMCADLKGTLLGGLPTARLTGVSTDTRSIAPGCLFFALQGERFDGHHFCREALEAGAGGVVVNRSDLDLPQGGVVVCVDDPLLALGRLAAAHRNRFDVPVIAVTGSVGKSTVKAWIATILEQSRRTLGARESYNNEIGLPLTLLELTADTEVVVLEMAMRGLGQIKYLCDLARPQIGVITNVGVSHLELLGSVANIAKAKGELFEALPPEGVAVADSAGPHYGDLCARATCRCLSCGLGERAAVRGDNLRPGADGTTQFDLCHEGDHVRVTLNAPGRHNVENALTAAAACLAVGVPLTEVAAGLACVTPPKMRLQPLRSLRGTVVLSDCYNSAPVSAQAAVGVARDWQIGGRRLAVLGDMKELGPESAALHRQLGRSLPAAGFAWVFAVGDYADDLIEGAVVAGMSAKQAISCEDNQQIAQRLGAEVRPDDLVLVKGSRAMQLEQVVEALCNA
ncbi:MAG: UDP-N-acetylmuramoyl-tripeptide--D-alanyl-D-alanine ligase [Armatimonadetes bacterium CG_4_10_14_3_um_filter_66_18]|nr:UDP-N-acetylmuramoyl-tripeptide--D-alanyl-D-alanine ligase [Armatimonadota bacterium]PIU90209.1 MAG: UDP-N-acetylmuramoyl-tripeptide--D-alanyl-D-alanine ligase [Armatimonadetes bacterium CG06_land_8_20_14_3_00_66_21]PIW13054.1 MAG: UDP-N-acetylmuramoyl-tripeptide--D-alanyl-D-alanine ligase [Armatimonadetes bacterium CG17_big_fil_post_rev_8_21_14_2_50_66_6]PIX46050.1 MAG: UDP-N-acetylmuramoyl-tripeptide--D-alanyl-D-alanine ligase [Armatimonadetes bacterium CG_4_8_14_3_um_filter_66_20]PIY50314